jgi:CTD kinase subunit beta
MFEAHSKIIIGLERLMLEASGFDFRSRYPQKFLIKLAKAHDIDQGVVGKVAYNMLRDSYRTFAPLKQTTAVLSVACLELAARVCDSQLECLTGEVIDYDRWQIDRIEVMGKYYYKPDTEHN